MNQRDRLATEKFSLAWFLRGATSELYGNYGMRDYRVFYDVDEAVLTVFIRTIRYKPPHRTTEDIL